MLQTEVCPKQKNTLISNNIITFPKERMKESTNKEMITINSEVHETNDGYPKKLVATATKYCARRRAPEESIVIDNIERVEQVDISPVNNYIK